MPITFRAIIKHLTGFSTPLGGVTWNPPHLEVDCAKDLFDYLEDRRYLYSPFEDEELQYVTRSLDQTRDHITELLNRVERGSQIGQSLIAMRAACRKLMTATQRTQSSNALLGFDFVLYLGELRALFGVHVAQLSHAYSLDVPDQLSGILPPVDGEV